MRGALTVERDLPAGTRLWLSAWSKQIAGADFISITAEIAGNGGFTAQKFAKAMECHFHAKQIAVELFRPTSRQRSRIVRVEADNLGRSA
jgi:hypothetical protein